MSMLKFLGNTFLRQENTETHDLEKFDLIGLYFSASWYPSPQKKTFKNL